MAAYINLFITAAFIENIILTFFLGMCTVLGHFQTDQNVTTV